MPRPLLEKSRWEINEPSHRWRMGSNTERRPGSACSVPDGIWWLIDWSRGELYQISGKIYHVGFYARVWRNEIHKTTRTKDGIKWSSRCGRWLALVWLVSHTPSCHWWDESWECERLSTMLEDESDIGVHRPCSRSSVFLSSVEWLTELGPECLTSLCMYPECLNVLTGSNFHQQRCAVDKLIINTMDNARQKWIKRSTFICKLFS